VARDLETVSGDQLNEGLTMLNALLSFKTAQQRLIPYFNEIEFNGIIGEEKYFIENLVMAETLTFNISTIRYQMSNIDRREYFGTPRADNIESLPYQYYIERATGGANVYMYFLPLQAYPFKLRGKFSLENVTLNQDLSLIYDAYYIEYLRYGLAEYMCQEYNISMSPQAAKQLKEFEKILIEVSPIDYTMSKLSTLQKTYNFNYAIANLSRGYLPP